MESHWQTLQFIVKLAPCVRSAPGWARRAIPGPVRRRDVFVESSRDAGILPFSGSGHPFKTDTQGRFELKGVIPGLKYTAKVEEPQSDEPQSDEPQSEERMMRPRLFTVFTDLAVASAETKQLGDLTVKPERAATRSEIKTATKPRAVAAV